MNNISMMNTSSLLQLNMARNEGDHDNLNHNFLTNSKMISSSGIELFRDKYFGTKEVGVQTDLKGSQIDDILDIKQVLLQKENGFNQKRNPHDIIEHYNNNEYHIKKNSYLGNKRKSELDNAEIETSVRSLLSQRNQPMSRLDIIHTMPFTETNASDLSSNVKSIKKEKAQLKKNKKEIRKKVDAYQLFENEFRQVHKELHEDEIEKKCKDEWSDLPKDVKRFYNMNAELDNKAMKKMQRKEKQKENAQNKALGNLVNVS